MSTSAVSDESTVVAGVDLGDSELAATVPRASVRNGPATPPGP
ncbi:hypothetical protein [Nocardia cyriacigeorgica]|nr:hypothetical protein [Nocardia cyriacigeorgica]